MGLNCYSLSGQAAGIRLRPSHIYRTAQLYMIVVVCPLRGAFSAMDGTILLRPVSLYSRHMILCFVILDSENICLAFSGSLHL